MLARLGHNSQTLIIDGPKRNEKHKFPSCARDQTLHRTHHPHQSTIFSFLFLIFFRMIIYKFVPIFNYSLIQSTSRLIYTDIIKRNLLKLILGTKNFISLKIIIVSIPCDKKSRDIFYTQLTRKSSPQLSKNK